MASRTHYATLGVAPIAPDIVIKAAHKALALKYHPDKTLHLPPEDRASYAATFRCIQEAYKVLSSPKLRASYDAELSRHNDVDDLNHYTTFYSYSSKSGHRFARSPNSRRPSIFTSPEEKKAIKAALEEQIAHLKSERQKRDAADTYLSIEDLKSTLKAWREVAEEHKNSPLERAHCQIRIHEYEKKIEEREARKGEWLKNLASPKHLSPPKSEPVRAFKPMLPKRFLQRDDPRKRMEEERKVVVCAGKEKLQQKMDEQEEEKRYRIGCAKAKAALSVPKGSAGATGHRTDNVKAEMTGTKKSCGRCKGEHASLGEWKKCMTQAKEETNEGKFLIVI
ncbi:DnaJ-domain-containing protein [Lojkania enalia]|uniref:DnaJ-domain-containing protein n=1 Tax=Lojkania enalia TaxID=147567 RepID=A0A9P4N6U1_9PLEO|nr:DnaJ-domain-containing protein [Didymosphaeria enalia]